MKIKKTLQGLLESYFTQRLMSQRQASPHTIASHRDTFRLLLGFARQRLKKEPSRLALADLDTPFLGAFLDHLEQKRHNSVRSRNVRLAAIHSFFRYVALSRIPPAVLWPSAFWPCRASAAGAGRSPT